MRHDLKLSGAAFRLRPVEDADAAFVVALRSDPELGRYLHRSSNRVEDQLAWLEKYYERSGDYYFVLERQFDGVPEGVIAVYDLSEDGRIAEWGRWILKPRSLAAVESAWLIYRAAFELIGLHEVYCRTVAENEKVVSFHDSCGIVNRTLLHSHFDIDGRKLDAIEHRVDRRSWSVIAPRLEQLVAMIARRIRHA
ncbi:N-acetyltransferase [Oxalobacteraceae bacterium OM1]|nr:N-acetyltransferase [Oxalobacteraceae bacterium OM1]